MSQKWIPKRNYVQQWIPEKRNYKIRTRLLEVFSSVEALSTSFIQSRCYFLILIKSLISNWIEWSRSWSEDVGGLSTCSIFHKIIITCGAPEIPEELLEQLKVGGKMVAPIGVGNIQQMQLIEKISDTEHKVTTHGNFSFVPMLKDKDDSG